MARSILYSRLRTPRTLVAAMAAVLVFQAAYVTPVAAASVPARALGAPVPHAAPPADETPVLDPADEVVAARTESTHRIQVSYNPRSGEVLLTRTRWTFKSMVGYEPGRTDRFLLDGGGRLCALGVSGYGNPYNAMFCGPARAWQWRAPQPAFKPANLGNFKDNLATLTGIRPPGLHRSSAPRLPAEVRVDLPLARHHHP